MHFVRVAISEPHRERIDCMQISFFPKETITSITLSAKFREKIIRYRITVKLKRAVHQRNMESGDEVQKSEYLAFTRKSGQKTTVVGPWNREIDEAEMSCECKRKNTSSPRHVTYREFHSLSLTPFYVRNSFSISSLFFSFSLPVFHDFLPLLVLYMSDSNESAEIHAIEIENHETRFHSRNAQLFHRRAEAASLVENKMRRPSVLQREKMLRP